MTISKSMTEVQMELERLWRKGFDEQMSFNSGVKGRGSDRWWEWKHRLQWGDMYKMRWTRRGVNRMKLTEWRRELIPQVRWCISERMVGDL